MGRATSAVRTTPQLHKPPRQRHPELTCAVQLLVVDLPGGPATLLVDTASRLLDREIAVTFVGDQTEALHTITHHDFDLIAVGLEEGQRDRLFLVRYLSLQRSDLPIIVVARRFSDEMLQRARRFGAQDLIGLPQRPGQLKAVIADLTSKWLS
jgi:CheY-like chemotaxis protein